MAIIAFKIECEAASHSVNIENWRLMTNCIYYYGQSDRTSGTRLVLPTHTIDIMGWPTLSVRKMINEGGIHENVVFSPNYRFHPGFCDVCAGIGKMDWVTSAMGNTVPVTKHVAHAKRFERNKERVLFYKSTEYTHGYDFSRIFAPTQVEDTKAETICKRCHGTGLRLDGRSIIFSGMPQLRDRLKEFEWDGLSLPDC